VVSLNERDGPSEPCCAVPGHWSQMEQTLAGSEKGRRPWPRCPLVSADQCRLVGGILSTAERALVVTGKTVVAGARGYCR
jgi:hypothetical protein